MSRSVQKTAQGQAIALTGADASGEPLTATPTTTKRTKKAAALTED